MPDIKQFTYNDIQIILNKVKNKIWEEECFILDIDFKTMIYIIDRLKKEFKNES